MARKLFYIKSSIRNKLLLSFLFLALTPLSIFSYITYTHFSRTIEESVLNNLVAIADSKVNILQRYIQERQITADKLAVVVSETAIFEKMEEAYQRGIDSQEYSDVSGKYDRLFKDYLEAGKYRNILFISQTGNVVFNVLKGIEVGANLETGPYKSLPLAKVFFKVKTTRKNAISDFTYDAPSKEIAAFFAAPVFKEDTLIGVVAFQVDNKDIFTLWEDYTGLGKTGETLAGINAGNKAIFINPLRHDPEAAYKKEIIIGSEEAIPIQEAVQGMNRKGFSVDYRNEKILAVWQHFAPLKWGVVTKIDAKEALEPLQKVKFWLFDSMLIALIAVIFLSILVSKHISEPIQKLHKGTEVIGRGDLDYKVGTKAQDEIGRLSRAFDHMTQNLKHTTASKDELEATKLRLEHTNKELENFAYIASHDLQEPLRKIISFGDWIVMKKSEQLDDEGKDFLNRMQNAAKRMRNLIEGLLAYSRVSTNAKTFKAVNLRDVIDQVLEILELRIKETQAKIEIKGDWPQIYGDEVQLIQLFQNLIGNALKFHKKGVKPHVIIETKDASDRKIVLSVKDNGIGFEQEYAKKIFRPFQRLNPRLDYEGSGIGLSICSKITKRHNGSIMVKSKLGEGSEFIVKLFKNKDGGNYD